MRILLGNRRIFVGSNIVSKSNVVESKVDRRTMRKMRYDQSIGCTTMFVYYDEIGNIVGPTGFCKFLYNIISSIDAMWIRENKSQLLGHYERMWLCKSEKRSLTLENCSSFELGSREVVIIILGSWTPALEYSLSICVIGSVGKFNKLSWIVNLDHTWLRLIESQILAQVFRAFL